MKSLFKQLFLGVLLAISFTARADLITEIGGGYKFNESYVLDPKCNYVFNPKFEAISCGGRNPVFIGWPLAWDFPNTRIGWFHMSHWIDGVPFNNNNETAFNCLCVTHTFHYNRHK